MGLEKFFHALPELLVPAAGALHIRLTFLGRGQTDRGAKDGFDVG